MGNRAGHDGNGWDLVLERHEHESHAVVPYALGAIPVIRSAPCWVIHDGAIIADHVSRDVALLAMDGRNFT